MGPPAHQCCYLLVLLFCFSLLLPQAATQRFIIKHDELMTRHIVQQAQQHGLQVLGQAKGFMVLSAAAQGGREAGSKLNTAKMQQKLEQIGKWAGVQYAEEDQPRFLQAPVAVSKRAQGQGSAMDCSAKDLPITNGPLPEYMPYGIPQIQANSQKLPTSTDKSGVMICVVDSGVDGSHPDFVGNSMDGCKYEDNFAPGGCPYKWSEDKISHGTHVVGTIAARRNGEGVVGVIPGGAEVYMVRVFNDSGDVNQGQGLVYGGTLILAFTQCEGRLAALQVRRE